MRMHQPLSVLAFSVLVVGLVAQETPPKAPDKITKERLEAAYGDARAACKDVLGAELEQLPPLKLVATEVVAEAITAENLPLVQLREPDAPKARTEADALGRQIAAFVWAKYSWSTKTFFVVPETWEQNARVLERPDLLADHTLRAVMVHELCHALDDRKFDLGKQLLAAKTAEAVGAYNAVLEGHAQLAARRVCKVRGWSDGFEAFTSSIGALPKSATADGEAMAMVRRATAAQLASAYVDGEAFAQAVLAARPETGRADIFTKPPLDADTILNPRWYLDPKQRPAVLHDPEPAIDAFVAKYDPEVWTATRVSPTGKQLATGLTLLPPADVDAVLASLRAMRLVQLVPTDAPQSKIAILAVMEFDSEESAAKWVALSAVVSDKKDEAMREGALKITASKTTRLTDGAVRGFLQEKTMENNGFEFEMASIDAWRGRCVVETIYSGEPPAHDEHVKVVEGALAAIAKKK